MQTKQLLQKVIGKACGIHKKRLEVLLIAAETLVKCGRLSVVNLGRGLMNGIKTKYNINRMDRLIGNKHLYVEAREIQQAITRWLVGSKSRPVLVVDWSSATVAERFQLLRAAVPVGGRTLTIYEEVHPLAHYNQPQVHEKFLKNLAEVLPKECCPIVVTDAGFGIPWFNQVLRLGWDFVGRVINKSYYTQDGKSWHSLVELLKYKRAVIKRLGKVLLAKQQAFSCYLQAYKATRKGRMRKNAYGEKAARNVSKKNASSARQAWVLAHSLGGGETVAKRVVKLYEQRMQIEESFRDIKNPRFGFGLRYSGSLGVKRLTNLLLVGLLGTLLAWLIGLCAKNRDLHYGLQTNSIKDRNVLSVFFIGCQIARHSIKFVQSEFFEALKQIREVVNVY